MPSVHFRNARSSFPLGSTKTPVSLAVLYGPGLLKTSIVWVSGSHIGDPYDTTVNIRVSNSLLVDPPDIETVLHEEIRFQALNS